MKNKRTIIITIFVLILVIAAGATMFIYYQRNGENAARQVLSDYVDLLNQKDYDEMYAKTASMNMSEDDFTTRNQNIYEGIGAENVSVDITGVEKADNGYDISYSEKMYTSAGEINFSNTARIVKEGEEYKLKWNSSIIFPELGETDKVRISTIKAKRGSILDRNGNALAEDGQIASVGIVPGKLEEGDARESAIAKISELTGVSEDYINEQLSASYVKDDTFVPIRKISDSNTELKDQLLEIPGILINKIDGRVYPLGQEAGHLIGYVQAVSADDLKNHEGEGYNTNSVIGKAGLEQAFEDTLRGIDGAEIYIEDQDGNRKIELAKQDKKDGQDVKLTIDSDLQNEVYEQMKDDKGFFVIMEPQTGELLALVSTPSYDSNDFSLGMTQTQWDELNNDEAQPLYNRFLQAYTPGSTFKPITGAIGLTTGKISANEDYGYTGTSWQKDSSWGNYSVTTLTAYNGPKNLLNGLLYSDNIYFAQSALKIGAKDFASGLDKLGFNEQLEFPLTLAKSQYAANNGTSIEGETKLADSGYGQGDILVNPIFMASVYSAFANDGNMIKPYIEYDESKKGTIYKENAFTAEAANTIRDDLIQVVENPAGTAHDMQMPGVTIAGKTGTAELKKSSDDKESGTLGWFDCFTTDREEGNNLLIISMVENVQDNSQGGSHYLIRKIRTLL